MIKYYYEDKNKKELITKIKDIIFENEKCFVKLENSIFYPQGGGQKGDKGYLIVEGRKYSIFNTIKDDKYNSILIMEDIIDKRFINSDVECFLDWEYRYRQMRLHTSLHIFHALIEDEVGKLENPILSTIEDGYAVNKYPEDAFDISILDGVTNKFKELIKSDIKVLTYPDKENDNYRYWESMKYIIPCGGIHVDNLNEINDVDVEITHKKKAITVKIILKD